MLTTEVRKLLEAPLIARLSVVDADGYPHTVPLWYALDGEDIVMISPRETKKVAHLTANPKACLCIGGGETAQGRIGPGYLFKGECTSEEDPGYEWLRRVTLRYEPPEEAERNIAQWREQYDMMVIRLRVRKVIQVYG